MTLPKWATTVTPFSKILAMTIFIIFPIIAFILGMKYQQIITIPQKNEFFKQPTLVVSPSKMIFPTNNISPTINLPNTVSITFGSLENEQVIRLEQKVVSYDVNNFVSLPSKPFDSKTTKIEELYDKQGDWSQFKFHDSNTDRYYVLQPGGHIEIGLTSENDIEKLLGERTISGVSTSGTTTKINCTPKKRTLGYIQAIAITCKSTSYLVSENNRIVNEDEITNCYLPISKDSFLSIKQISKPVSTNIDMCNILDLLGYQNIGITES